MTGLPHRDRFFKFKRKRVQLTVSATVYEMP